MSLDANPIIGMDERRAEASTFVELVFDNAPVAQLVGLFRLPSKRPLWLPSDDVSQLATALVASSAKATYVTHGLRPLTFAKSNKLGGVTDVVAIPGVVLDVDLAGPAHKEQRLPATIAQVDTVLKLFPATPTLRVWSGHGLQLWWLFNEWWTFRSNADRTAASALTHDLHSVVARLMLMQDWALDSTATLERVWRPPGTLNRKVEPTPVRLVSTDGPRHEPRDLAQIVGQALANLAPPVDRPRQRSAVTENPRRPGRRRHIEHDVPSSDVDKALAVITAGCGFVKHCYDDRKALPEPHWFLGLWTLSAVGAPDETAQAWSMDHPGYDRRGTTEKFAHLQDDMAWAPTCEGIRNMTHGQFCDGCPSRGALKSPIELAASVPNSYPKLVKERPPIDRTVLQWINTSLEAIDAADWSGKAGTSDRQLLDLALMQARLHASVTIPLSIRFVAIWLDWTTARASRSLRRLVDGGFLVLHSKGSSTLGSSAYTLTLPTWALTRAIHMHPAGAAEDLSAQNRQMYGLTGTPASLVLQHLVAMGGEARSSEIAGALGKGARWATKALSGLEALDIVQRGSDKRWRVEPDFSRADAATSLGVLDKRTRRRERLSDVGRQPAAAGEGTTGTNFVVEAPTDAISRNPKSRATFARNRKIKAARRHAELFPEELVEVEPLLFMAPATGAIRFDARVVVR